MKSASSFCRKQAKTAQQLQERTHHNAVNKKYTEITAVLPVGSAEEQAPCLPKQLLPPPVPHNGPCPSSLVLAMAARPLAPTFLLLFLLLLHLIPRPPGTLLASGRRRDGGFAFPRHGATAAADTRPLVYPPHSPPRRRGRGRGREGKGRAIAARGRVFERWRMRWIR